MHFSVDGSIGHIGAAVEGGPLVDSKVETSTYTADSGGESVSRSVDLSDLDIVEDDYIVIALSLDQCDMNTVLSSGWTYVGGGGSYSEGFGSYNRLYMKQATGDETSFQFSVWAGGAYSPTDLSIRAHVSVWRGVSDVETANGGSAATWAWEGGARIVEMQDNAFGSLAHELDDDNNGYNGYLNVSTERDSSSPSVTADAYGGALIAFQIDGDEGDDPTGGGGGSVIPPGTDNYISLESPSQLTFSGIRWLFTLSHDWDERYILDAEGEEVDVVDLIDGEDGYVRDGAWYQRYSEGSVEGFEVHGCVDGMWWQIIAIGDGVFLFTNGDELVDVELIAGAWYAVEAQVTDGYQAITLLDSESNVLAAITSSAEINYEYVGVGASGTVFYDSEPLDVGFDQITFDDVVVIVDGVPEVREEGWDEPSEGWNSETVPVTGGLFSIAASPVNGSVNVYSLDGEILDCGTEWVETNDDGDEFRLMNRSDTAVTVVYFVARPILAVTPHPIRPVREEVPLGNLTSR